MSKTSRRVMEAVRSARSNDDLVQDGIDVMWDEHDLVHPLDKETLDERAAEQMGPRWEPVRRYAE